MEVVSEFYSLIEQYSQYRMFIERAEKQKGSYPSQVIQKVVLEYQLKADMEADRIRPVVQKLLAAVSSIDAEIEASALSENDKEKLNIETLRMFSSSSTPGPCDAYCTYEE